MLVVYSLFLREKNRLKSIIRFGLKNVLLRYGHSFSQLQSARHFSTSMLCGSYVTEEEKEEGASVLMYWELGFGGSGRLGLSPPPSPSGLPS